MHISMHSHSSKSAQQNMAAPLEEFVSILIIIPLSLLSEMAPQVGEWHCKLLENFLDP